MQRAVVEPVMPVEREPSVLGNDIALDIIASTTGARLAAAAGATYFMPVPMYTMAAHAHAATAARCATNATHHVPYPAHA